MKKIYTSSDVGGVLIGTKDFGIVIRNGDGDGRTTVHILSKEEENLVPNYAKYNTSIKGTFNIYSYDCSPRDDEDIVATLSGKYSTYYFGYDVYFVESKY